MMDLTDLQLVTETIPNGLVTARVIGLVLVEVADQQTIVLLSNATDLHQTVGQPREEMTAEMTAETSEEMMLIPTSHLQVPEPEADRLQVATADVRAAQSTEVEMTPTHQQDAYHHEGTTAQGLHRGAGQDRRTIHAPAVHPRSALETSLLDARPLSEKDSLHQIAGTIDHARLHEEHIHHQEILEEEATDRDLEVPLAEIHTQMIIGGEGHHHLERQDQSLSLLRDDRHLPFIPTELA